MKKDRSRKVKGVYPRLSVEIEDLKKIADKEKDILADGTEHLMKRKDQFKDEQGHVYQGYMYKGILGLWSQYDETFIHPREINYHSLHLIPKEKASPISEMLIHLKLYGEPVKSAKDIELTDEEIKRYERNINEKARAKKEGRIPRKVWK